MPQTNGGNKQSERYIAFYLSEGFWADAKPDYSKFGSRYWLVREFTELMEEPVVIVEEKERKITICRDGMIMYSDNGLANPPMPLEEQYQRIAKYAGILNALLFVFVAKITELSGIKRFQHYEITHNDVVSVSYDETGYCSVGLPQKTIMLPQLEKRLLSNVPHGYEDCLDEYLDHFQRTVLPQQMLTEIVELFLRSTTDPMNIRLLSRANKAATEFEETAFSDCIISAWTEIEVFLYEKLKAYMSKEGSARFNKDRNNILMNSSPARVSELLETVGEIEINEYRELNKVRRNRNDIIHKGLSSNMQEASEALRILENVIESRTGEAIKFSHIIITPVI